MKNKIPEVSSLVKKTSYDTEISKLEEKLTDSSRGEYITTSNFNNLAAVVFNSR